MGGITQSRVRPLPELLVGEFDYPALTRDQVSRTSRSDTEVIALKRNRRVVGESPLCARRTEAEGACSVNKTSKNGGKGAPSWSRFIACLDDRITSGANCKTCLDTFNVLGSGKRKWLSSSRRPALLRSPAGSLWLNGDGGHRSYMVRGHIINFTWEGAGLPIVSTRCEPMCGGAQSRMHVSSLLCVISRSSHLDSFSPSQLESSGALASRSA
ncbi:hypothetical protein LXA43DRAFT_1028169 [Ganoderma leucocontextum]|nr:hypothetical protein LXA43DRAFT_1028169 [Ganoderma leucocontextum]